jgi:enoyl-CoA hydratase/carnithine racemase
LFGGEDFNGELAERYGYVNRAVPDREFESFVHRLARRVSTFDREALADIKYFVNNVSLPDISAAGGGIHAGSGGSRATGASA